MGGAQGADVAEPRSIRPGLRESAPPRAPVAAVDRVTPIHAVEGPLTTAAESYPFGAADHQEVPQDLGKLGYVEEEYLVSGTHNVYTWAGESPPHK